MTAIELCRTAVLGGHFEACEQSGHRGHRFHQLSALRMQYFHIVFTLLEPIAALACLIFRATVETLRTIAADPKHLGSPEIRLVGRAAHLGPEHCFIIRICSALSPWRLVSRRPSADRLQAWLLPPGRVLSRPPTIVPWRTLRKTFDAAAVLR
ncbi:hypothetical protein [Ensifer sp. LCM 4579]|uniref:hypothetical protein n=1 Tax=Ensifer sp. LCM 4579 TaxID=1848292 RepID=UPI00104232D3|nr:hypothetical protein [Ensifer sp. LCM 4579]